MQMTVMVIWCVRVGDVAVVRGKGIVCVSLPLPYLLMGKMVLVNVGS